MSEKKKDDDTSSVRSTATNTEPKAAPSNYKVRGEDAFSSGTAVLGHNTATSGTGSGVTGVVESDALGATAVEGQATATSGGAPFGVVGWGPASGTQGVVGSAEETPPSIITEAYPTGVWGLCDKGGDDPGVSQGVGVWGSASGAGLCYGVYGDATSVDGYGVYSDTDSRTNGNHELVGGTVYEQRGDPTTGELADGDVMTYNSDGSGTGDAGDLVYAVNDGGTIKTSVVVQRSNAN